MPRNRSICLSLELLDRRKPGQFAQQRLHKGHEGDQSWPRPDRQDDERDQTGIYQGEHLICARLHRHPGEVSTSHRWQHRWHGVLLTHNYPVARGDHEVSPTSSIRQQSRQLTVTGGVGGDDSDIHIECSGSRLDGCSSGIKRGNVLGAIGPRLPLNLRTLVLISAHRNNDDLGARTDEHLVDSGRSEHRDDTWVQDRPVTYQNLAAAVIRARESGTGPSLHRRKQHNVAVGIEQIRW